MSNRRAFANLGERMKDRRHGFGMTEAEFLGKMSGNTRLGSCISGRDEKLEALYGGVLVKASLIVRVCRVDKGLEPNPLGPGVCWAFLSRLTYERPPKNRVLAVGRHTVQSLRTFTSDDVQLLDALGTSPVDPVFCITTKHTTPRQEPKPKTDSTPEESKGYIAELAAYQTQLGAHREVVTALKRDNPEAMGLLLPNENGFFEADTLPGVVHWMIDNPYRPRETSATITKRPI